MGQARSTCAIALAVMISAGGAHADDPPSLRDMLSTVPLAALDTKGFPLAAAVDLAAARRLLPDGNAAMSKGLAKRLSAGAMIRPLQAWQMGVTARPGTWEEQVAVAPTEIDAFVGYGSPPQDVAVWFLRSDAGAKAVFDDLPRRGFSAIDGGMMANGQPGAIDIKGRRLGDPWRDQIGKTSVVANNGRNLFQAAFPTVVAAARTAAASNVTRPPVVDAVLRGAEALSRDGVRIVQALLSSPAIGIDDSMPTLILEPKTIDEMRKTLEEQAARNQATGLPPYAMALITDIVVPGKGHGVAVVFAHFGCAQAEEGGKRFITRWTSIPTSVTGKPLAELAPTEAAARTVPGSDGLCASVVTLTSRSPVTDDGLANRPWDVILNAIMQRDFVAAIMALGGK